MDSYEECIKNEINQIANKDIFFDIDAIMSADNEVSERIVATLLSWACTATNTSPITIARKCIIQFPVEWISSRIKTVAAQAIDCSDWWDYRRLLELSEMISADMLKWALNLMTESKDEEIIEALSDFNKRLLKYVDER